VVISTVDHPLGSPSLYCDTNPSLAVCNCEQGSNKTMKYFYSSIISSSLYNYSCYSDELVYYYIYLSTYYANYILYIPFIEMVIPKINVYQNDSLEWTVDRHWTTEYKNSPKNRRNKDSWPSI
jgi:hypothetical protein